MKRFSGKKNKTIPPAPENQLGAQRMDLKEWAKEMNSSDRGDKKKKQSYKEAARKAGVTQ